MKENLDLILINLACSAELLLDLAEKMKRDDVENIRMHIGRIRIIRGSIEAVEHELLKIHGQDLLASMDLPNNR